MSRFRKSAAGYEVFDRFLPEERCAALLRDVREFVSMHELPDIHRPKRGRSLRYNVIDGLKVRAHLQSVWDLFQNEVLVRIQASFGATLQPLRGALVGANINLMSPNRSEYRWHYDRNRVSALIYLNAVDGGETELYPNYRMQLPGHPGEAQRLLDGALQLPPVRAIFGRKSVIVPAPGRMLVFRGDRCWHSVRPVTGTEVRINLVFAYDLPRADVPAGTGLDSDLYSKEEQGRSDPNYG